MTAPTTAPIKGEAEHGVDEVIEMGKRLVEKGPPK
jgi:hypothetical protein